MSKIGLVAVLEEVAEERDELLEANEHLKIAVSQLRVELADTIAEAERRQVIARRDGHEDALRDLLRGQGGNRP
ncbi:MAG: hypothetical protein WCO96_01340 [Actinomycetes bacterium]